jgi:anti-sigma factor RsiW
VSDLACKQGVELLMDYLEGELAADVVARIDAHVASCARCRAFVASYRATPEILRRATRTTLPAELSRSLLAAVRAATLPSPEDR